MMLFSVFTLDNPDAAEKRKPCTLPTSRRFALHRIPDPVTVRRNP
jgi:hypothetical protein